MSAEHDQSDAARAVVLDTDALVALIETGGQTAALVTAALSGYRALLPRTVVTQFLRKGNAQALTAFVQEFGATIVDDGPDAMVESLRGIGLHDQDARIAATAQYRGVRLLTFDKRLARRAPDLALLLVR